MTKQQRDPAGNTAMHRRLRPAQVAAFRRRVRSYYQQHGRSFPWRASRDPYAIVVSEIMLQQTQTSRVANHFGRFLKKFPTFAALARASLSAVLWQWQGLGYNRRALYLRELALTVMQRHGGKLPDTLEELKALPGVGAYTAGALYAFVHEKPAVFIETNIRSVFLTEFFPGVSRVSDKQIAALVLQTLDRRNPRHWYYALMDYGVACKRKSVGLNLRSAHYVRQSPLKGSVREVRGRIIKELSKKKKVSVRTLQRLVQCNDQRLGRALAGLERDGLITKTGGVIAIR